MPFWVVVESWDFGVLSKYFEILKGGYQNKIAERLGLSDAKALSRWLHAINLLRNRCAHHVRIWNQSGAALPTIDDSYFAELNLDGLALSRLYGVIAVIWFLVKKIGPGSDWISRVADLMDDKPDMPGCTYAALGFPTENGFPRELFGIN